MKRILVTGSRELPKEFERVVGATLEAYVKNNAVVVHGGCPTGADYYVQKYVHWRRSSGLYTRSGHLAEETHPAKWHLHGKAAGPIRNQEMVDLGADICLAFFYGGAENRGTQDCFKKATVAGISTVKITIESYPR